MEKKLALLVDGLVLIACLLLMTARPAHAYLDPGTGSYALQVSVAGILGALFSLKMFWRGLASAIRQSAGKRRGLITPAADALGSGRS